MRDAPRHRSALRRVFRIGRGASRTACDAERSHDTVGATGAAVDRTSHINPIAMRHVTRVIP
ncbi:DUF1534 domain-containing protein, partial [Pseudomonas syringae pv. actinidiae]|nr:DUF1534 domain-containing protein [Pseudomonas syringae pv. actinidiae]